MVSRTFQQAPGEGKCPSRDESPSSRVPLESRGGDEWGVQHIVHSCQLWRLTLRIHHENTLSFVSLYKFRFLLQWNLELNYVFCGKVFLNNCEFLTLVPLISVLGWRTKSLSASAAPLQTSPALWDHYWTPAQNLPPVASKVQQDKNPAIDPAQHWPLLWLCSRQCVCLLPLTVCLKIYLG